MEEDSTDEHRREAGAERARRWYADSGLAATAPVGGRLGEPYRGPLPAAAAGEWK